MFEYNVIVDHSENEIRHVAVPFIFIVMYFLRICSVFYQTEVLFFYCSASQKDLKI